MVIIFIIIKLILILHICMTGVLFFMGLLIFRLRICSIGCFVSEEITNL